LICVEARLAASTRVPRTLNAIRWYRSRQGLGKKSALTIPVKSFSNSPQFHRSSSQPPRPFDPTVWLKSSDVVPAPLNLGFESE
jgi:hypothetical protein